jgi:DUF971 family protein
MVSKKRVPTAINYHSRSKLFEVSFGDEGTFSMTAEYLRVYSPSAEVRGHGQGQEVLQIGKEGVGIDRIEPVGHYAVRLCFDDGHDTGLYTWSELYRLGVEQVTLWQDYLDRLDAAGQRRKPVLQVVQPGGITIPSKNVQDS